MGLVLGGGDRVWGWQDVDVAGGRMAGGRVAGGRIEKE